MKKTIIDIVKIIVAAIVAIIVASVMVAYDASDGAILLTGLCVAGGVATLLGVFRESADKAHGNFGSIRRDRRHYGQAAVFVGTAAIFMGTPQECDELADDLQHYAQQAHVEMLTGEETLKVL